MNLRNKPLNVNEVGETLELREVGKTEELRVERFKEKEVNFWLWDEMKMVDMVGVFIGRHEGK